MTQEEKRKIENFMQQGKGYRFIAAEIGLPVNTVKSWIQRNKPKPEQCLQCGSIIHSLPHKKKKKFCSDKCRYAWWSSHPSQRQIKKPYKHICLYCGTGFISNRIESKYCTVRCFGKIREKVKANV